MSRREPRAIVFDLDGTLVDSREDIAAACNHTLASLGRAARPTSVIAGFVGDGACMLVARALGLEANDPIVDRALTTFSAYYRDHAADHATFLPGAEAALDACGHLPIALVTNKPRSATEPLLLALDLTRRFSVVIAGGDGPLKPDPAAIIAALAPLDVPPAHAWVVGDGPQDIQAGRAAGAFTLGVLGGFATEASLRDAEPDLLLRDLHELPHLLSSSRR